MKDSFDTKTLDFPLEPRRRRGRPSDPNKLVFKTYGLRPDDLAWLEMWFPGGSPTDQLNALIERAKKFWPAGPGRFR